MAKEGHEEKLEQTMEELTVVMRRLYRTQTIAYGFWHGLVVGIASTVGVAIVLSGLVWLLQRLEAVPTFTNYVDRVLPILEQRK